MREVLPELMAWWRDGKTIGVGTVVGTWRSAPRPAGASMLVGPDRSAVGSVSGGCVEGSVYELAEQVVADGQPVLQRYGVSDEDAFAVGLTCGGRWCAAHTTWATRANHRWCGRGCATRANRRWCGRGCATRATRRWCGRPQSRGCGIPAARSRPPARRRGEPAPHRRPRSPHALCRSCAGARGADRGLRVGAKSRSQTFVTTLQAPEHDVA